MEKTYNISTTDAGRWYCFCAEVPISVTWKDKDFDDTQEWDYTGEADELAIAREARELTDWLTLHHREKLFGSAASGTSAAMNDEAPLTKEEWRGVELRYREDVGCMVQKIRMDMGYTQGELAKRCGLTRSHIARIEAGLYNVTIDTLGRILWAVGAGIDFYYDEDAAEPDDDYFEEPEA